MGSTVDGIERYVTALNLLAPKTYVREFLGARVLCPEFMLSRAERLARMAVWKAVKDYPLYRMAHVLGNR